MKVFQSILFLWFSFFLAVSAQAASLNISPTTMASDYQGWLNLQIDGLPNAAQCEIQVILDFDGDGSYDDGSDFILETYTAQDGVAPAIMNRGLTGDEDGSTDGSILTRLNYWQGGHFTGNYLIRFTGTWGQASKLLPVTPVYSSESVSGKLLDSSGNRTSGVILSIPADSEGDQEFGAITDDQGNYTLYMPGSGSYFIVGVSPGSITRFDEGSIKSVTLSPSQNKTGVNVRTKSGTTTVSGTVTGASSGLGIANLLVELEGEDETGEWQSLTLTDSSGNFTLPAIEGESEFWAESETRGLTGNNAFDLTVPEGGVSNLEIELTPATAWISGRLTRSDTGAGIPGIYILVESGGNEFETITAQDGYYAVGVAPGTWDVKIDEDYNYYIPGFIPPSRQQVSISKGQILSDIDFEYREAEATLQVTVEDAQSNPLEDVSVWVNDAQWNFLFDQNTDENGQVFLPLENGTYWVGISCDDISGMNLICPQPAEVIVSNGSVDPVVFDLQPGVTVSGQVLRESDSQPIPYAWVTFYSDEQPWQYLYSTSADSSGNWSTTVPEGSYRLFSDSTGYLPEFYNGKPYDWNQADTVTVGSGGLSGIDFTLAQAATLELTVLSEDTQAPVTSAQVTIYDGQQNWLAGGSADLEGKTTIEVPPGDIIIMISPYTEGLMTTYYDGKEDFNSADAVTVTDGQTLQLTVNVLVEPPDINPDVNDDGFVDANDLIMLQKYWQQPWPQTE